MYGHSHTEKKRRDRRKGAAKLLSPIDREFLGLPCRSGIVRTGEVRHLGANFLQPVELATGVTRAWREPACISLFFLFFSILFLFRHFGYLVVCVFLFRDLGALR